MRSTPSWAYGANVPGPRRERAIVSNHAVWRLEYLGITDCKPIPCIQPTKPFKGANIYRRNALL